MLTPGAGNAQAKKKQQAKTFVYGLCGPNVCRIDAKTRRSKIVLRRSTDSAYTAVSASPSGSTLAFVYDGSVFRSGRDGRGRRELDTGGVNARLTAVSPNGRDVAWAATVNTTQARYDPWSGTIQLYPVIYDYLYRQGLADPKAAAHGGDTSTFGWYRGELIGQESPEEGEADFICVVDAEGDCTRTLVTDPTRAYSSPATSPDGRYLAVVSEPVPPEDGDMDFQGRIEIWNPATGRKVRDLTQGTKDDTPIFSPDGKRVAYNSGDDVLVRSVRGGKARLIKRDLELTGPSWAKAR
jgi:Tol biopolymer transport system component